jgi:hypothetical protein
MLGLCNWLFWLILEILIVRLVRGARRKLR